MKIIENEYIVMVDVDETLVMHDISATGELLDVKDPLRDRQIKMRINGPMVRLVQEEKARGAFIVVWSRGGRAWATAVVEALKLEESVDLIMAKPMTYFDDKDVSDWLKYRVYLTPDTIYKK